MPIYFIDFERQDEEVGMRKGIAIAIAEDGKQAEVLVDRELFGLDGRHPRIVKSEEMEAARPGVPFIADHVLVN